LGRLVNIVEKTNGVVNSNNCFLWSGANICEQRDSSGAVVLKRFYPQGEVLMDGSGITRYFYTKDHLGSIREALDSSALLATRCDYDPQGQMRVVVGNRATTFTFSGHFLHAASGLYLTLHRPLDSSIGRWLSRDPIEELGGVNLYAAVRNDPVNWVDPYGLKANINCLPPAQEQAGDEIPDDPTTFTVVGHGNQYEMGDPTGKPITSEQLANKIRNDPNYKQGEPVELISCNTGSGSFAQDVANDLNAPVWAPDNKVILNPKDGKWQVVKPGKMKEFKPSTP
jgi:RHS repeat-associated protein